MQLQPIGSMPFHGQDGAFFGDFMFRLDARGNCQVYDAAALDGAAADAPVTIEPVAHFTVGNTECVIPHFNAVVFGCEYYAGGDEFPLLYANVYNNYAREADRREGTCCVYRLQRTGTEFSAALVQVIRIGFTDDVLWRSAGDTKDVRPYGNFVIDTTRALLHVFTMRDADHTARYFTFALPALGDGGFSEEYGVRVVTLGKEDIRQYFDTDYHLYIQGACCHNGLIYSSEGFNAEIKPSLRVIDPAAKRQLVCVNLAELGYPSEAEWIDFRGDVCYYSDGFGQIFRVCWDDANLL